MITLLGSLLGFTTSFLPSILSFFQAKDDRKHELSMVAAQASAQAKLQTGKIQEAHVNADIREIESLHDHDRAAISKASRWVVNLSASVRPVITYLFFIEWATLTVMVTFNWLTWEDYASIWDEPTQGHLCGGRIVLVWVAVVQPEVTYLDAESHPEPGPKTHQIL